jgi:Fe-S cluster assembly protein SufD
MPEATCRSPLLEGAQAWIESQDGDRAAARRAGLECLEACGVPTRSHEDWRFTSLGPWTDARSSRVGDDGELTRADFSIDGLDAIELIFVNGRLEGAPQVDGLRVSPWSEAEGEVPFATRETLSQAPALEQLNQLWCDRGVVIEVEANTRIDRPVHLQFLSGAGESTLTQPRVVLRLEPSSGLHLVEDHRSTGAASATNLHLDVELGANAALEHVQLTRVATDASHATTLRSVIGRDARHRHWNFVLSGAWVRNDLHCRLGGENSEVHLMGLTVASGAQMVDAHTRVEHAADHSRSIEDYRHVLDDEARVVFAGRVHVGPDVHDSDAEQRNANLLLSPSARMNALPQLEIYNDDVKASHGSSMGRLDEDALFYMRSRGIDAQTARGLLLWGFANSIVQQLKWPAVAALVQHEVHERLAKLTPLESAS